MSEIQPAGQGLLEENKEETISIMEIVMRYARYWKWFLFGILIALAVAFVYLRYTTPIYEVNASIILKDAKSTMGPTSPSPDGLEFGMFGAVTNVENEMYIMRSRSLISNVINRLNLHTSYIVEGRVKDTDLYTSSPIIVDMEQSDLDRLRQDIILHLDVNNEKRVGVTGIVGGITVDTVFSQLPALLRTPYGNISFTDRKGMAPPSRPFYVQIQHPESAIQGYRAALTIQPASKQASVLDLSIQTPYPQKGRDFLNALVEVYNNETIQDNKMEASNTQAFINERILIINRELTEAELDVEEYKRSQGLSDIQTNLQRDIQMGSQYEQQLVQVETQLNVVNSLNEYVNNPNNVDKTIPANVGIDDPTLAATTSEYNRLLLERERLSQSMTNDNPAMV
ncbi:MAG: Wzz/FepE/Etk N-terminal domain-containing protein, partial [Proteiniphilum sp.]